MKLRKTRPTRRPTIADCHPADVRAFEAIASLSGLFMTAEDFWQWFDKKLDEYGRQRRTDGHGPQGLADWLPGEAEREMNRRKQTRS